MLRYCDRRRLGGSGSLKVDVGSPGPPTPTVGVRLAARKPRVRTPGNPRNPRAAGDRANASSTPANKGLKMRKIRRHGPVGTPGGTEGRRARRLETGQKADTGTPSSQRSRLHQYVESPAPVERQPRMQKTPSASGKSRHRDPADFVTSPSRGRPSRLIQKYQPRTRGAVPVSLEKHSPNVSRQGNRRTAGMQSFESLNPAQTYSPRNAGRVKMVCAHCGTGINSPHTKGQSQHKHTHTLAQVASCS